MVMTAARISQGWPASDLVNSSASPEVAARDRGRHADLALRRLDGATASLSDAPGARLKLMVTEGNWSWCVTASGAVRELDIARDGV